MSISDLKKALVNGGLKKNKYLIELTTPIIGFDENKLNILCRSASFPERGINLTTVWHKGRKYNVRAETDYSGSWVVTFLDDSKMTLRKGFDKWLKYVDNSKPSSGGIFSSSSYENGVNGINDIVNSAIGVADTVNDFVTDPLGKGSDYVSGLLDPNQAYSKAEYQVDINVWQLSANGEKVYGYKMQNAFISSISQVDYNDSELDSLVEFSVTFTYSEFLPLDNTSNGTKVIEAGLGDGINDTIENAESLFD